MSLARGFVCWVVSISMRSTVMAAASVSGSAWHCDAPALSPDGLRVAYVQWDSPFVRIVVVNLAEPGRTNYFRLGKSGIDPVTISWRTPLSIELRRGDAVVATFMADSTSLPSGQLSESRRPSLPPLDESKLMPLLQQKLPHRTLSLVNSDDAGTRVLLFAAGARDGGRFFVYDRTEDLLFEVARRKSSPTQP
jgi:hypothetical protein